MLSLHSDRLRTTFDLRLEIFTSTHITELVWQLQLLCDNISTFQSSERCWAYRRRIYKVLWTFSRWSFLIRSSTWEDGNQLISIENLCFDGYVDSFYLVKFCVCIIYGFFFLWRKWIFKLVFKYLWKMRNNTMIIEKSFFFMTYIY